MIYSCKTKQNFVMLYLTLPVFLTQIPHCAKYYLQLCILGFAPSFFFIPSKRDANPLSTH